MKYEEIRDNLIITTKRGEEFHIREEFSGRLSITYLGSKEFTIKPECANKIELVTRKRDFEDG